ncbi:unnamed protein product [Dovyalis caffra]|uniref:Major facilitator superfamily (MFS) profile domain-containing protein n=1 Tax=Dovyalis caffra TaxID=77055 RepID=A0AAV1SFE0_9ROSI|nr:unnamed protein product [Dovyalis caffra]
MTSIRVADIENGRINVNYPSKLNCYAVVCWGFAACAGLMFGYDIGISGGVTAMNDFLIKFFPDVYRRKLRAREDNYCKYDDQKLQLFTSSLYLAALASSFLASSICKRYGRKRTMLGASLFFLAGAGLSSGAQNICMLIIGRISLGVGVGFGNEAAPLFLSETATVKLRGAINILFQLFVTMGILMANSVNYGTSGMHKNGWRLSLGLAAVPAFLLFVGSIFIDETPTSLVEQDKEAEGKRVLRNIRGVEDVDAEFEQIKAANERAKQVKGSLKNLMKRSSLPPVIIGTVLQVFQQFTGINAIMFYAPVLFQTVGFKNNGSLVSALVTGFVNVLSTLIAVFLADKAGRRFLLRLSSVIMFVSQVIIGIILVTSLKATGSLPEAQAYTVLIFVCLFVFAFAWSWGPLGWLIPSETFPVETRTAGFAFAVSSNMLFTFIIAQAFLSMMCHMRAGIFFFFSAWILVMGLCAQWLLPETKGVPIDLMVERVWKQHWFWKRFMD